MRQSSRTFIFFQMDMINDWTAIKRHFNRSFKSNFHVAIASVDKENHPTVTPIGSLFLNDDQTGFYFEKYPGKLPENYQHNPNICVLAVNSSTYFWLSALFRGQFNSHPGIKLYGQLGIIRQARSDEMKRFHARMSTTKWLKGNAYLWGEMDRVREITFSKAEKINLGKMTAGL